MNSIQGVTRKLLCFDPIYQCKYYLFMFKMLWIDETNKRSNRFNQKIHLLRKTTGLIIVQNLCGLSIDFNSVVDFCYSVTIFVCRLDRKCHQNKLCKYIISVLM